MLLSNRKNPTKKKKQKKHAFESIEGEVDVAIYDHTSTESGTPEFTRGVMFIQTQTADQAKASSEAEVHRDYSPMGCGT